jgi:hypothetical protein
VSISNTQLTFFGGLFDLIEHLMLHTKTASSSSSTPSIEDVSKDASKTSKFAMISYIIERLIEKLTPELLVIHVENIEVKSLNKQNSYHYHLLLQRAEVKGKFAASNFVSMRLKASNMRIYTPVHEVLHLKDASMDVKSSENVYHTASRVDTLNVVYDHEDIYGWYKKIFTAGMKSNRKKLIVEFYRLLREMMIDFYYSEVIQKLFSRIVVNHMVEIRHVTLVAQLSDQVSSINLSKGKFQLNQSEKLRRNPYEDYTMNLMFGERHWSVELISDGPLCVFIGNEKYDCHVFTPKTYIRGSALFVGSSFIRIGSYGDCGRHKLDLRVNTLRTEYSKRLTDFIIKMIKSYKEFDGLFSQLHEKRNEVDLSVGEKKFSVEKLLNKIEIEVRLASISCFFINRHDVCVFGNLAEFSSKDVYSYVLDSLEVSTVDLSKYESVYDLSDHSNIYVSTKKLKFNLIVTTDQPPQICVDFAEKLECSWNAHFLRHLLSIARDFHRFKTNAFDAFGIVREQKLSFSLPRSLPSRLPVGFDIKKLRNIRIKHSDVNVDKLLLLIQELSGENLFFYSYFH